MTKKLKFKVCTCPRKSAWTRSSQLVHGLGRCVGRTHTDIFRLSAVIDDPDGFTLVRSQRSASSQVVARVNQGEPFYTYTQDGNWWQVMTRDGKVGYMHVSRIKIVAPR